MPPETLTQLLSVALFIITCIGGALYKILRDEAKEHHDSIEKKATNERLSEVEQYLTRMLEKAERDNKDLIREVKETHHRDINALTTRLCAQISGVETNLLGRMEMMLTALNSRTPPH